MSKYLFIISERLKKLIADVITVLLAKINVPRDEIDTIAKKIEQSGVGILCSQSALNTIIDEVVKAARECLSDKLDKVILYGSYARGDFADGSDIDIMVLADIPHVDCWKEYLRISDLTWELDLEHDVLVSLNVTDCATFYKYASVLPFYINIIKEGVALLA